MICTHLHVALNDLLTDSLTLHPEFVKVLTTVAVSTNHFVHVVLVWKNTQLF